jgi:hypothetical protein
MNKLVKTVIALGKRVLVKRTRSLLTWGIVNPEVPLENVNLFQERQAFIDSRMNLTLRDVQFRCRKGPEGCDNHSWIGAVEGTPEVETPVSDRTRVPIRFDGRLGQFYRVDTVEKIDVAKRLYLLANGKAEAEFLD